MTERKPSISKAQAAESIRALRKAGLPDDQIRADYPEYAHGWDDLSVQSVAKSPAGSSSVAAPLRSITQMDL